MSLDRFKEIPPLETSTLSLPQSNRFRGKELHETGDGRTFFESWLPVTIPRFDDDKYTEVGSGEDGRLDIIATRIYGSPRFWWILAVVNNIFDVFEDLPAGTILRYPTPAKLFSYVLPL